MIRSCILILSILALSLQGMAQSSASFGLVGGLSQTWDVDEGENTIVNRPGFSLGIFRHVPLTEYVRFQAELAFVQRIVGYDYSNSGVSTRGRSVTNMVQIPLWFQFGRKTYFGIGMAYGFPLHIKSVSHVTTTTTSRPSVTSTKTVSEVSEFDEVFRTKLWDVGLTIGRRSERVAWEIRPTVTVPFEGNFWRQPYGSTTFQVTGVVMWRGNKYLKR